MCSVLPGLRNTIQGTVLCADTVKSYGPGVRIKLAIPLHLPWANGVQTELVVMLYRLMTMSLLDGIALAASDEVPAFRRGFRPLISKKDFLRAIT